MNTKIISYEARRAIQIGYASHWRFRVVGQGEVPAQSFYKDEWVFEPINAPQVAQDRIETLKRFGFNFKGFVIAHEAPRLLSAPEPKKQDFKNNQTNDILPDVEAFLGILLKGFLFFLTLIFQVALLDPALIVILEDGTWLEVMTWYE